MREGNGYLCGWPSNGSVQRSLGALPPDRRSAVWKDSNFSVPGPGGKPLDLARPVPARAPCPILQSNAYIVFLKLETNFPTLTQIAP